MRRPTRSSTGHSTSPEGEKLHQHEERSTRSRRASEDLVILELPRITRIGKRGGKLPDPARSSAKSEASMSTENEPKPSKHSLAPVETGTGTRTKKRRRSGRLAEAEEDKEKLESDKKEKEEKVTGDVVGERKGRGTRERGSQDEHVREREGKVKETRENKVKAKDSQMHESLSKETKKIEDDATLFKELVGATRRRTRSGRHGQEEEIASIADQATHPGSEVGQFDKDALIPEIAHESKSGHGIGGTSSQRGGHDKARIDVPRLKSPPKSPEKSKKAEMVKVELQKLDLDLGELTSKSGRQSTRGALSPPLRMSPRRARQHSGQREKEQTEEVTDVIDYKTGKEMVAETTVTTKESDKNSDKIADDKADECAKNCKRSTSICRDLSEDFEKKSPKSPTRSPSRQSRAKKEEDNQKEIEAPTSLDNELATALPKSPKVRRSRSPVKSPRDSATMSPRKGLRSFKPSENGDSTEGEGNVALSIEHESKVDVVSMEAPPPASLLIPANTGVESEIVVVAGINELETELPEHEEKTVASETLALEEPQADEPPEEDEPKDEDDVREISDDVAAKIREWKMQEEDNAGFLGDEWYTDEIDEGEPFYFESDHMALKGNKDYRMLLRTITTLEAQRKQAVKDLDKLVTAQKEALRNPLKFVQKLQKKDNLHLPSAQRIVLLPDIPWSRYLGHADSRELVQGLSHQTRASFKQKDPHVATSFSTAGSSGSHVSGPDAADDEKNKSVIRGRLWDDTKPETFNRLWTVEEQKHLEALLGKFPSEEVEARRWEKIAKELGNRTRHQVASRVQKYFIKLSKAGLPVPGRIPNMSTYTNKKPSQRRYVSTYNRLTLAPSTFLQSIRAPVLMTDDDDYYEMELDYEADSIMDDDDVPPELKESEEYKELVRLKRLRNLALAQQTEVSHVGFSCDGCGASPIVGARWHCMNCPAEISTDLCASCVNDEYESDVHTTSHQLEAMHSSQSGGFVDTDYTSFTGTSGDYNYLDPNYSPAIL